jgi:hypothetical protein
MSVKLNYKNITRDLMKSIRHYAMLCLIAVCTFPLEADTSFKVVGCLEYILLNIWELLTDFSALPARTAFWVDIEFKIEQIRRKNPVYKN